jgi:hypothetical protein
VEVGDRIEKIGKIEDWKMCVTQPAMFKFFDFWTR